MTSTAYTFVITVDNAARGPTAMVADLRNAMLDTANRLGWRLVPCNWAPDPDTISDATGGRDIEVVDLN
jgi:hypothetical protein